MLLAITTFILQLEFVTAAQQLSGIMKGLPPSLLFKIVIGSAHCCIILLNLAAP